MEYVSGLRCRCRHEDSGKCTAVGGFCTAVTAAHCPLLCQYLDTGLTPEEVLPKDKADEIALKLMRLADLESLCSYTRLRELAEADKDGRLFILPLEPGRSMLYQQDFERPCVMKNVAPCIQYQSSAGIIFFMRYYTFSRLVENGRITPLLPEGEKTLEAMKDE